MACWLGYKPRNIENFIWILADPVVKSSLCVAYTLSVYTVVL